jgi:hypothetical protein
MTDNHTIRLYTIAATVFTLFVSWAAIAAHPWETAAAPNPKDARLVALAQRETLLRRDMALVQKIAARAASLVATRTPTAPTAAPAVRVVTLPPLVITRTS